MSLVRRWGLSLSPRETGYERRGFRGANAAARARLESIGTAFLNGYHCALERGGPEQLAAPLEQADPDLRGFTYEGAAMGLALLDWLTPWRRDRLATFLRGAGEAHAYMVHVGIG
jgi:enediyne biosynthesis protein E3